MTWSAPTARRSATAPPADMRRFLYILAGILFAFTVLIVVVGVMVDAPEDPAKAEADREATACVDSTMAYVVAQNFVKQRLVSPATADFPWLGFAEGVASRHIGDCRHRVTGYVDSQNRFGATVRTRFVATVRYNGGERWGAEEVSFPE